MTLHDLNRASTEAAVAAFLRCCGSKRWSRLMAESRPYPSLDLVHAVAERVWWSLDAADWLEAFAAHPRIGERATTSWSAEEQAAASTMERDVRNRLIEGNKAYEERFGYTFIICATGKPASEIVSALESRLPMSAAAELQIAAAEQRKITTLRLTRLLS